MLEIVIPLAFVAFSGSLGMGLVLWSQRRRLDHFLPSRGDDAAVQATRELQADAVLVLLWRCFEDGSTDQARWEREELDDYTARAALLEANVLMVNGLAPATMEGGSFGGAWAWDPTGRLVASLPLGRTARLLVDL